MKNTMARRTAAWITLESNFQALFILINCYIENMMCNKPGNYHLLDSKT